jgi:hypothetical protein
MEDYNNVRNKHAEVKPIKYYKNNYGCLLPIALLIIILYGPV